jgi:hypothetical protein
VAADCGQLPAKKGGGGEMHEVDYSIQTDYKSTTVTLYDTNLSKIGLSRELIQTTFEFPYLHSLYSTQ